MMFPSRFIIHSGFLPLATKSNRSSFVLFFFVIVIVTTFFSVHIHSPLNSFERNFVLWESVYVTTYKGISLFRLALTLDALYLSGGSSSSIWLTAQYLDYFFFWVLMSKNFLVSLT